MLVPISQYTTGPKVLWMDGGDVSLNRDVVMYNKATRACGVSTLPNLFQLYTARQ